MLHNNKERQMTDISEVCRIQVGIVLRTHISLVYQNSMFKSETTHATMEKDKEMQCG